MSAISPKLQMQSSRNIDVRTVVVNDPHQIPFDYGTTPGGTIFSTTPGGTRIVYERRFLLQCRNSPHSKSPPANLPTIPGVTAPAECEADRVKDPRGGQHPKENIAPSRELSVHGDEQLFQMDI